MELKYQLFLCSLTLLASIGVVSSRSTTDQPIGDGADNNLINAPPSTPLTADNSDSNILHQMPRHPQRNSTQTLGRDSFRPPQDGEVQDDDPVEEVHSLMAVRELPDAIVAGDLGRRHQMAAQHVLDPSTWTSLGMSLTTTGHHVQVDWDFHSNETRVTGFVVCYRMKEREDYDSSKLELRVRSFTLHSLHQDEEYEICVHVMINTTVIKEVCAPWSEASKKMIVGIAVGGLFLVPMTVLLVWFYSKDKKIRKQYAHLFVTETKLDIKTQNEKAKVEIKGQSPKITSSGHHHDHHHHHDNAKPISKGQGDSNASTSGSEPRAVYINTGSDEKIDT